MKKIIFAVLLASLFTILFIGCTSQTVITYKTLAVTENPVGTKVGQVDRTEGGTLEAAKNAGISRISTVSLQNTDTYVTYYWPMLFGSNPTTVNTYHKAEIIVTGE